MIKDTTKETETKRILLKRSELGTITNSVAVGLTKEAARGTLCHSMNKESVHFSSAKRIRVQERIWTRKFTNSKLRSLGARRTTVAIAREIAWGAKSKSSTSRAGAEARLVDRRSILIKREEKTFWSQSGRNGLMNRMRAIIRGHDTVKVLTNKEKAAMETLSELDQEVTIREVNTR
jgi:hypothetical protein